LLRTPLEGNMRKRVILERAHAGVQAFGARDLDQLRAELESAGGVLPEFQDDRLADLISLDVELRHGRAFFGGWWIREGADAAGLLESIRAERERAPHSNRIGELRFYEGLCEYALGHPARADQLFAAHARDLPKDRFALLSRLHESSYAFSPLGDNQVLGGSMLDPATIAQLKAAIDSGVQVQVQSGNGQALSKAETKAMLDQLLNSGGHTQIASSQKVTETSPNNFMLPAGIELRTSGELDPMQVIGTGPTPLILIPGLGFSAEETWGDFARRNGDLYSSHLVSLPGFGGTAPWALPADATDFEHETWLQRTVIAIAEQARQLKRPLIAGHFVLGAEIAMRCAEQFPELFDALVCVSDEPGRVLKPVGKQPMTPAERSVAIDTKWTPFFEHVSSANWSEGMYRPDAYSRDPTRAAALWSSTDAVPVAIMVRWFLEYQASNAALDLGQLELPILVLAPEGASPPWFGTWPGLARHEDWPQLSLSTWKRASSGAFPMHDAPLWFDQTLRDFVRGLSR